MSRLYVLVDKTPIAENDANVWSRWHQSVGIDGRRVGFTKLGDVDISTVFLGMDHGWGDGPPVLFETMPFGGQYDSHCWRWHTWAEAEAGHAAIVAALREGRDPYEAIPGGYS